MISDLYLPLWIYNTCICTLLQRSRMSNSTVIAEPASKSHILATREPRWPTRIQEKSPRFSSILPMWLPGPSQHNFRGSILIFMMVAKSYWEKVAGLACSGLHWNTPFYTLSFSIQEISNKSLKTPHSSSKAPRLYSYPIQCLNI